jgi:hypothetical protein
VSNADNGPIEQPAVRTTIVGGRPPGSGKAVGPIPRGIEVLVKKASVDGAFREALMTERAEAAKHIGLELTEAEKAMLRAIPAAQLAAIVGCTRVEPEKRRIFLGASAAAMLIAVGVLVGGCRDRVYSAGEMPDRPENDSAATQPAQETGDQPMVVPSEGIRPDLPETAPARVAQGVRPVRPAVSRGIAPDRPPAPAPQPQPPAEDDPPPTK